MGNYLGLVFATVALLAGFALAFGALTIIWRRHWVTFGARESVLARLAAATVLAMLALGGSQALAGAALQALQPSQFVQFGPAPTLSPAEGRNQSLAVVLVALALTVVAVLRIELYHRRVTGISHRDESEDEWQSEEPEEPRPRARVPRERDSV